MIVTKINICGVDLLKKGSQWVVIEVNSNLGLDFIEGEEEKLILRVLNFLKKYYREHLKKSNAKLVEK